MFTRLFGRLFPQSRDNRSVVGLRLRIEALIPAGCVAKVADVQLQQGRLVTGWTPAQPDLGVEAVTGWQWRNGALPPGTSQLIVNADVDAASPTVWDVRGIADSAQIDGFYFGSLAGEARVDGMAHIATQGAGIPPHLTARADIDVTATTTSRLLLACSFRGIAQYDQSELPPQLDDEGPAYPTHPTWRRLTDVHTSWGDVLAIHEQWR